MMIIYTADFYFVRHKHTHPRYHAPSTYQEGGFGRRGVTHILRKLFIQFAWVFSGGKVGSRNNLVHTLTTLKIRNIRRVGST